MDHLGVGERLPRLQNRLTTDVGIPEKLQPVVSALCLHDTWHICLDNVQFFGGEQFAHLEQALGRSDAIIESQQLHRPPESTRSPCVKLKELSIATLVHVEHQALEPEVRRRPIGGSLLTPLAKRQHVEESIAHGDFDSLSSSTANPGAQRSDDA